MNKEDLKTIINNFREYDWNYDNSSKTATYNNDFNLQVKLQNVIAREDDESLEGEEWDELFKKYPESKSLEVAFLYRGAEVAGFPAIMFNDLIIPLPVAASMIDEFYENEISIARMLTDDKKNFYTLLSGCKKRKKNY